MADEPRLKSSFELAMERLQKKDEAAGVTHTPLTDAQKADIAEIRNRYEAKLAEIEVLHQGALRTMVDPAERDEADADYRRERDRLTGERDGKIERARHGQS